MNAASGQVDPVADRIRENVASIRDRIATAAAKSGRSADDVTLVGVTKYVGPELAARVIDAGVGDLGESRPQQLIEKHEAFDAAGRPQPRWHLIGPLQRNKARRVALVASLIQSADRLKLIQFLNEVAEQESIDAVDVLLEVNVSGDAAKHGLTPTELPDIVDQMVNAPRIRAQGLMAMGGRDSDPAELQRQFHQLRALRDACRQSAPENAPLVELSMGMTGDFELAVEAGATIVRVGSGLFDGVST